MGSPIGGLRVSFGVYGFQEARPGFVIQLIPFGGELQDDLGFFERFIRGKITGSFKISGLTKAKAAWFGVAYEFRFAIWAATWGRRK